MRQPPSLTDGCIAPRQRLVWKAQTEQDETQIPLCYDLGVASGLSAQRMVGIWVV